MLEEMNYLIIKFLFSSFSIMHLQLKVFSFNSQDHYYFGKKALTSFLFAEGKDKYNIPIFAKFLGAIFCLKISEFIFIFNDALVFFFLSIEKYRLLKL